MEHLSDRGMTTIAEYGTRFGADVAAAHLTEYGIQSTVMGDPAHSVAPHHVTHPGFALLVLEGEADDACEVLGLDRNNLNDLERQASDQLDATLFHRHFRERPRWIRYATYVLLLSMPIPMAIAALIVIWEWGTRIFPG